jgi:hypothetical protein
MTREAHRHRNAKRPPLQGQGYHRMMNDKKLPRVYALLFTDLPEWDVYGLDYVEKENNLPSLYERCHFVFTWEEKRVRMCERGKS